MNKKILIICGADPRTDPRPNRMIDFLKNDYEVTVAGSVVGKEKISIEGVKPITVFRKNASRPTPYYEAINKYSPIVAKVLRKIINSLGLLKRFFHIKLFPLEQVAWSDTKFFRPLLLQLQNEDFNLIINHDLNLMPFVFSIKKKAKVLFDAREFYPRNFDDQLWWRFLYQPVNEYLCEKYLPQCDKVITVCEGLAQEYNRVYKVLPEVIMSLPNHYDLKPSQTKERPIRIVHHGWASVSRRIETMIEMMDYVDERFYLDLMLLRASISYWDKLVAMVRKRKNIRIVPPISMEEIVPFTNSYDIGLFLCKPTNFNLKFTLPNKLFEFIQSRLTVAIGPSIEMKKIVEKYDCGIISNDFEPKTLAEELNKLTVEKIMYYKEQSHKASLELNSGTNAKRVKTIVQELIQAN